MISNPASILLGDSAPSKGKVYHRANEFGRGRTSCEDEHRAGRPNEVGHYNRKYPKNSLQNGNGRSTCEVARNRTGSKHLIWYGVYSHHFKNTVECIFQKNVYSRDQKNS